MGVDGDVLPKGLKIPQTRPDCPLEPLRPEDPISGIESRRLELKVESNTFGRIELLFEDKYEISAEPLKLIL